MRIKNLIYTLVLTVSTVSTLKAQLSPNIGQYFFNPYLANIAFAGKDNGLTVSALVRRQFASVTDGPLSQAFTADYHMGKHAGIGLIINNEKAGIFQQTRGIATYAYHLPVGAKANLNFGIGLGLLSERVNQNDVIGQGDDPTLTEYNDGKTYLDGAFGIAYTTEELTIEGTLPNMKSTFNKNVDRNTDNALFYTAASYKFRFGKGMGSWSVEPKVAYRGIKEWDDIFDVGAQVGIINDQFRLVGLYHSSKNASFGLGYQRTSGLGIQALYSTSTNSSLSGLGSNFEINVKFRLFN